VPDFVGAIVFTQGLGHIAFRAVARDLYDHGPGASASTFGWGAGVSGDLHVFGRDRIIVQSNGGYGIGRYISNTGTNSGDSVISADGKTLKTVQSFNAGAAYQHFWTDSLRSTVAVSFEQFYYPKELFPATAATFAPPGIFGQLNRQFEDGHLNLIWSPIPPVDLGVEFIYLLRKTEGNQRGNLERTQISAKFKF
jgi:hypothetical protein